MLTIRKIKAVSLIEIMVALLVMGSILGGVLLMFSKGSLYIEQIETNELVVGILEEQLELIRQNWFDDIITNFSPSANFSAAGFAQLTNPVGNVIVDYPFASTNIIRVTVTVTWDTSSGGTLSKSLVTYITDGGLSS